MTTLERDRATVTPNSDRPGGTPPPAKRQLNLPLVPSLEKRRLQAFLMLMLLDGLVIIGALAGFALVYYGEADDQQTLQQICL